MSAVDVVLPVSALLAAESSVTGAAVTGAAVTRAAVTRAAVTGGLP